MTYLSPHFTLEELNGADAPDIAQAHLQRLSVTLEAVRAVLGVPLRITDGYRTPEQNAATVGASATSAHLTGDAADFVPVGMTIATAASLLVDARDRGDLAWGEMIFYPWNRAHIHITSPGVGGSNQTLVQTDEGAYAPFTDAIFATFPGAITEGALGVASALETPVTPAGPSLGVALAIGVAALLILTA